MLDLAQHHAFARPLVNSGRLSTPTPYVASSLNTPDRTSLAGPMTPGTNAADAPVIIAGQPGWLLNCLGSGFTVLTFDSSVSADEVRVDGIAARVIVVGRDIADAKGLLAERYGASSPPTYVFRPDQYATARFPQFDETAIAESIRRACGKDGAVQQELAA